MDHTTSPTTNEYVDHAKELWKDDASATRPLEVTIMEVVPLATDQTPADKPAAPKDSDYADAWNGHA
jgi:hypothetical protein